MDNTPPLGCRPKFIVFELRRQEITAAMDRYRDADKEIPQEWKDEIEEIREYLNNRGKVKKIVAPLPGDWKLIEMPESWDIASRENAKVFGVFARIDKNEVFPGQARANALCMVHSKHALKLLKTMSSNPNHTQEDIVKFSAEVDDLMNIFEKEGILL